MHVLVIAQIASSYCILGLREHTMAHISLHNVSLDFPIYGSSSKSLKNSLIRLSTGGIISKSTEDHIITVKALDNLNLVLNSGDRVGLIGHNGAGKSSLLRVLAGIYEPSQGVIDICGKVTAVLDVMMGLDYESTGYENIVLRGVLNSLTLKQIKDKQQEIADFTELGGFLSIPVKTYSSGMMLRLAFAIATCIQPEILILDEIVSVGDAAFLEKAKERMSNIINVAEVVVIASHDPSIIKTFCTKVIIMDAGKMTFFGDVEQGLAMRENSLKNIK